MSEIKKTSNSRIILAIIVTGLVTFTAGYTLSWYNHPTNEDYDLLLADFTDLQTYIEDTIQNLEDSVASSLNEATQETDNKIDSLSTELGTEMDSLKETQDTVSESVHQIQDELSLSPVVVYNNVKSSLVTVNVAYRESGRTEYKFGSGFIYDLEGHIVTNNHVIEDYISNDGIRVRYYDGSEQWASFVASDPDTDIAVLKVEPNSSNPPIFLARYSEFEVGDQCTAIGTPYGYEGSLTNGVVSHKDRTILNEDGYSLSNIIQFDASVNPGSSGGVLLSREGELIGVTTAGILFAADGMGFAIGSELVDKIVSTLILNGTVNHPYMGIGVWDMNLEIAEEMEVNTTRGLLVTYMAEGSPAEAAGLEAGTKSFSYQGVTIEIGGDIIMKINDHDVIGFDDFASYIDLNTSVGDVIVVTILRDNVIQEIELTLGERPY